MPNVTEGFHDGEFLISESEGFASRQNVTVVSGQKLGAGRVIGLITMGAAAAAALGTNTGNGTVGAITVGVNAMPGAYVVTFLAATVFTVQAPNGVNLGHGATGSAFNLGSHLTFTITAGGTAFAACDQFTLTVAAGSGKATALAPAGTNGSQYAAGILLNAVDATSADAPGVAIVRDAEVNESELDWGTMTAPQITTAKAQLLALGILVRSAV